MINKRKLILSVAGLLVILLGFWGMGALADKKKAPRRGDVKAQRAAFVKKVQNHDVPVSITAGGTVVAKDRLVLFSEVQGVFMPPAKAYKTGQKYRKGEVMIRINNEEFYANVLAKRSAFLSLINAILPDIKFDYPASLAKWKTYWASIDVKKDLPPLPETGSGKEKNFILGKSVVANYYSIKNMETRLRKYTIRAPYDGVLVEADVTPGTLINPGQKLGQFVKPGVFEVELNVNAGFQDFLKNGSAVGLHRIDGKEHWTGKVVRINDRIDPASQTLKIFVQLTAPALKEGEYLEADIPAKAVSHALEVPNRLLIHNNSLFVVEDGMLKLKKVEVIYSNLNSVIVRGLKDGDLYLAEPLANAYEGMEVKIMDQGENTGK